MTKSQLSKLSLAVFAGVFALPAAVIAAPYEGFGDNIPMKSAIMQIVPDGWFVEYDKKINASTEISWSSAKDWKVALNRALAARGYTAEFASKSIKIMPASSKKRQAKRAKSAPAKVHKSAPKNVQQAAVAAPQMMGGGGFVMKPYTPPVKKAKAAQAQPAVAPAPLPTGWLPAVSGGKRGLRSGYKNGVFTVAAGSDLRAVLEVWAKPHGWTVSWNSQYTYPIESSARYRGVFVDAARDLVLQMKNPRPRITAKFYIGNRTVVLENAGAGEVN
ncbi:TcpQ domain-containing protein [Pseudovibrio ascidiaceicola]|uniref:TcpQ domain-containing protein n=1 Tax=Pseudovibrio ascidiaceicola TaxID=285279 RepID=UPI003D366A0C